MPFKSTDRELKSVGYELFLAAVSILSLVNLVLIWLFAANQDIQAVLHLMNAVVPPIFLGDFLYRLWTATDRWGYFLRGFGWADLFSALPLAPFRILRIFRILRSIALLREFGPRRLLYEIDQHRARNALLTAVFLVVQLLEFGSLAVLLAEEGAPDANIAGAQDALWWTYATITTVGYGDRFPVTFWGRIVGILVMTAGVGLFGTLSGFLAQAFLSPARAKAPAEPAAEEPRQRVAALLRQIEEHEQAAAELRRQLEKAVAAL